MLWGRSHDKRDWRGLTELKVRANEQDVPYQSLMEVYLAERLVQERRRRIRRDA